MSMNTKKSGVFIFVLMSTVVFVRSLARAYFSDIQTQGNFGLRSNRKGGPRGPLARAEVARPVVEGVLTILASNGASDIDYNRSEALYVSPNLGRGLSS